MPRIGGNTNDGGCLEDRELYPRGTLLLFVRSAEFTRQVGCADKFYQFCQSE